MYKYDKIAVEMVALIELMKETSETINRGLLVNEALFDDLVKCASHYKAVLPNFKHGIFREMNDHKRLFHKVIPKRPSVKGIVVKLEKEAKNE